MLTSDLFFETEINLQATSVITVISFALRFWIGPGCINTKMKKIKTNKSVIQLKN